MRKAVIGARLAAVRRNMSARGLPGSVTSSRQMSEREPRVLGYE
jgi:hypothetical protein